VDQSKIYSSEEPLPINLLGSQTKAVSANRMNQVKDIFLLSCYTGLAYADVKKLKADFKYLNIDGERVLVLTLLCKMDPHFLNRKFHRDYSYEFIKISKARMIVEFGGDFFYLNKVK
jgi:hypothetical protein